MNKVICDICGTTYTETAAHCPICGFATPENADIIADETVEVETAAAGGYTYVKGGRFSEKNVRKRNKERMKAAAYEEVKEENEPDESDIDDDDDEDIDDQEEKGSSNRGLIMIIILLLLAILASMAYLYFRYFAPEDLFGKPTEPAGTTTSATEQTGGETTAATTVDTTPAGIPCTDLAVSADSITLDSLGRAWLLNVTTTPADTTDSLVFYTSDSGVATVTAGGLVTAVAPGETSIIVECGDVVKEIPVSCTFELETEPTEPAVEPITGRINVEDRLRIRATPSASAEIAGYYNANEMVEILETQTVDGTVWGRTDKGWISMDYVLTGDAATAEPTKPASADLQVYINGSKPAFADGATFVSGDVFEISLVDSNGNEVDAYWSNESPSICKIENGMTCTAGEPGSTILRTTYNGKEYQYIVRVKAGS